MVLFVIISYVIFSNFYQKESETLLEWATTCDTAPLKAALVKNVKTQKELLHLKSGQESD